MCQTHPFSPRLLFFDGKAAKQCPFGLAIIFHFSLDDNLAGPFPPTWKSSIARKLIIDYRATIGTRRPNNRRTTRVSMGRTGSRGQDPFRLESSFCLKKPIGE